MGRTRKWTPPPLTRLSPEQQALLPAVRDEWLSIGLSTAPADRARAEEGVYRAYRAADLLPPAEYVWCDSPLEGARVASIVDSAHSVKSWLWRVKNRVLDQVWGGTWGPVGRLLTDQVGRPVERQVWDQVGSQVWDQLRDQIPDEEESEVGERVWRGGHGQHDAYWLAEYAALARCGVDVSPLAGLTAVAQAAGWWWPFHDVVVLTDRPTTLHRDADHRLHCADGPALRYPDGWGIWAWHGVRVPRAVIETPESLTAAQITAEPNIGVRRVMLERWGAERYLREVGGQRVHQDDWGTLWRTAFADDEPLLLVEVLNSTPEPDGTYQSYWLRVPPQCQTAREAVSWTFGETAATYAPTVQT